MGGLVGEEALIFDSSARTVDRCEGDKLQAEMLFRTLAR